MQTEIRVEGERRMPLALEEAIYRIALEALNNVIKHAAAQQVTVDLSFNDEGASLEIEDNGVGFDPAAARQSGGRGLLGMEERVQRIGGTLIIESAPGRGTTVRVGVRDRGAENLGS
jgi:signal transduction histidine kinase